MGPLIRVVGDRNPSSVKAAIISTLHLILKKAGASLRAFTPQLQTTFVKSLSDTSRTVRLAAISALRDLMAVATRVDPLVTELTKMSEANEDVLPVKISALQALAGVVQEGGAKVKSKDVLQAAFQACCGLIVHGEEAVREASSRAITACLKVLGGTVGGEWLEDFLSEGAEDASNMLAIGAVVAGGAVNVEGYGGWCRDVLDKPTSTAEAIKVRSTLTYSSKPNRPCLKR